jgi:hypothetical protein
MAQPSWIFDPNSSYGAPGGQSQVDTPRVSGPGGFLNSNEDAAYYLHIAPWAPETTPGVTSCAAR